MIKINTLYNENCLDTMKSMEDNSIHAIVTDPPYGLSFMGKKWDYDVPSVDIWKECLRVLKPGGYLLSFAGTRTQHRMAVNIEDAGFEIRDMIAWVYGSGFPKSLNISKAIYKSAGAKRKIISEGKPVKRMIPGADQDKTGSWIKDNGKEFIPTESEAATEEAKQWEGWGTALKPALEPITVARKPLSEKTVSDNILKWGVGGINIDACRIIKNEGDRTEYGRDKELPNENNTNSLGKFKVNTPYKEHLKGRFPANFIHDGSEEVTDEFPETGQPCGSKKNTTHKEGMFGIGQPGTIYTDADNGNNSASRFFYTAKTSKSDRNDAGTFNLFEQREPTKNTHPTVKPTSLMKYLIKLVNPPGGIVYDPFTGSGSTLKAAKLLEIDFIGSEIEKEYCDIANARVKACETL